MSVSPLASMTGFARQSGGDGKISWTWEIKSVNGKSLEARIRLPQGFEGLEGPARQAIQAKVGRGNLQVSLNFDRGENRAAIRVNEALLDEYLRLARRLEKHGAQPASADGLLGLRGVLELGEEEKNEAEEKAREAALLADLAQAIEQLVLARRQEGARLGEILLSILGEIGRLVAAAEGAAATQPEALRQRLKSAVDELLEARPALAEDRLAQELALLILKADVREELDRLDAHIKQLQALLKDGGAVGRKLDFLCQELNREANTLCSKSVDLELTRIGLDLKGAIDRLREQALNLE